MGEDKANSGGSVSQKHLLPQAHVTLAAPQHNKHDRKEFRGNREVPNPTHHNKGSRNASPIPDSRRMAERSEAAEKSGQPRRIASGTARKVSS